MENKSSLFEFLEIEEMAQSFESEFTKEELEDMGILYKPWAKNQSFPEETDLLELED